jgi:hypothetical protein
VPHSPVIDLVHPEALRDSLIREFKDFIEASSGTHLKWTKSIEEALAYDAESGGTVLTDEFVEFCSSEDNWVYPDRLFESFPDLAAYLRTKTEQARPSSTPAQGDGV